MRGRNIIMCGPDSSTHARTLLYTTITYAKLPRGRVRGGGKGCSSFGGGGGGSVGWGPVVEHLPSSTTEDAHGVRHRHDVKDDYQSTLSERISSLRIDDGRSGGGGGRFEAGTQVMADHEVTADQLNPQNPIVDDVDDSTRASTDDNLHDFSIGLLSNDIDTTAPPTTTHKSEDGLFASPEVPYDHGVLCSKSANVPLGIDSCPTPQVDIPINSGDTLDANEPKTVLLERRKSLREPEDAKQHKTRLLACPYPKHDPETHGYRCRAAAFTEIHRLKEHLYRVHTQPPHCVRCGETFSNESDVKAHLSRPDEICDFVAGVPVGGLNSEQIKKLRSKKRKPGVTTNEEKWQDIFGIVFPDATDFPDPYYSYLDDRSNDRYLLPMGQSDVESIFSDVPPESEDRIFTKLEQICGPLENSKRRKVWDTIQHFFVERAQQIMGSKTIPCSNRDAVHPHGSSPASISFGTTAPEAEQRFAEAQWSTTQNHAKDPGQPVLETTPAMRDVKNLQATSLQDHLECHLSQFPNENAFTQVLPQNTEITDMDSENPPNKCIDAERPVSIPNGSIMGDTNALDALVSSENWSSFDEFFDFESILNGPGEKHVDSASVDWLTEHANL